MTDAPLQSLDHATEAGPGATCDLGGLHQTHAVVVSCEGFTGPGNIRVVLELSLDGEHWWRLPYVEVAVVANGTWTASSTQPNAWHDVSSLARYSRAVIQHHAAQAGAVSAWVEAL